MIQVNFRRKTVQILYKNPILALFQVNNIQLLIKPQVRSITPSTSIQLLITRRNTAYRNRINNNNNPNKIKPYLLHMLTQQNLLTDTMQTKACSNIKQPIRTLQLKLGSTKANKLKKKGKMKAYSCDTKIKKSSIKENGSNRNTEINYFNYSNRPH